MIASDFTEVQDLVFQGIAEDAEIRALRALVQFTIDILDGAGFT